MRIELGGPGPCRAVEGGRDEWREKGELKRMIRQMLTKIHNYNTVIWFYFVLYLISYAAVRTKIKRTNIIQQ